MQPQDSQQHRTRGLQFALSSTEQQGMPFALKSAALLLCLMIAHLFEQPKFTGVTQMGQHCCQLVLQSSKACLLPSAGCSAGVFGHCTLV